jgi:phage terminase small subunit
MIPAVSEPAKKKRRTRHKKPPRTVAEVDAEREDIDVRVATVRHEKFAQEFIKTLNRKEAAINSGYDPGAEIPGPPPANPRVNARILELMDERAIRTGITADKVLHEIALIGFSNIKDFMTWDGGHYRVKPDTEIPDEIACAIKRIWYDRDGNMCIELYDKLQALDKIAKHLGMFTQRVEIEARITGRVDVANGLNRLTNDELLELRALAEKMALPERSEVIDGEPVKKEET